MKLTIGIPVYNGEKYISRCIDSILKEYEKAKENIKLELLIVNDGSKDNSKTILKEYSEKISQIKVITQTNSGLAHVRRVILEEASGDYLWFVDVDDEIDEGAIEFIANQKLEEVNIFDYRVGYENSKLETISMGIQENTILIPNTEKKLFTLPNAVWHYIYDLEFLRKTKVTFKSGYLYEDFEFMSRLWPNVSKAKYFNFSIYKYYLTEGSIMRGGTAINKIRDIEVMLSSVEEYYAENYPGEFKEELEYFNWYHILYGGYANILRIDETSPLLDEYLKKVKIKYPNWIKNKYLKSQPLKRKILMYLIKYNQRKIVKKLLK
ncbi:glycosyltransferase [Streptococcus sp. DTU_2020_1001019_1_SI_AUS_MUR_006]|uniref:glycosyltransferase n=1 Tax=Streptococcus sp. DTU_2020_1001019_1_SI_AUS_MUR_006 TaxID=3077584 RepID=UPI0028F02FB7|nr:glycosyltransferase [Streptococcus sp. DTU_2020_1001019_1_SI_AUS_MUR_006]WNS72243.1 glycosyltransferase [Streptococcus sp. DTU_2020_1001019_1_SI_AUS_MUR_006]